MPSCQGLLLHLGHHSCTCRRGAGCCEVEQIHVLRPFGMEYRETISGEGISQAPGTSRSFAIASLRNHGKPLSSPLLKTPLSLCLTNHKQALTKLFSNLKKKWFLALNSFQNSGETTCHVLLPRCLWFFISIDVDGTPGTKTRSLLHLCA